MAAVSCSEQPVTENATDAVLFPGDSRGEAPDRLVAELRAALEDDPRVGELAR